MIYKLNNRNYDSRIEEGKKIEIGARRKRGRGVIK
jgi:hypothetical protein